MADEKVQTSPKRTLQSVFQEAAQFEKKLLFSGPDNIRPDSRHAIVEICADHVVLRLVGEDLFVIPYAAISSLTVGKTQIIIRYR